MAGATGLVGGLLVRTLLDAPDYTRVYALTRRPYGLEHPRLANRVVVFDRLAEQLKGMTAHDAYCCLGTTIADAGSEERFRAVDHDLVLSFARAMRTLGVSRFVVVSSARADSRSKNFYLRTKGEMEEALTALGFPSLDIMQPSLLLGPRKQLRPKELVAKVFAPLVNPFLTGPREALRAIPAETVAKAMLGASRRGTRGVYRYTYSGIRQLAEMKPPQSMLVQPAKKPGR